MADKMTVPVTKEFSDKMTGIPDQLTAIFKIKDVRQRAKISKLIIDVENNEIQILWSKEFLDEDNNLIDASTVIRTAHVRDIQEGGEAELDETNGYPKMETYKKNEDENLSVTNWYAQLGRVIFIPALRLVQDLAGFNPKVD